MQNEKKKMKKKNDVVVKCSAPCVFRERADNGICYCMRDNIEMKNYQCSSFKYAPFIDDREEEVEKMYPLFTYFKLTI